jgi:hypothetical protein
MRELRDWIMRERIATWMLVRGYATHHADGINGLLAALEEQAKKRGATDERRASAQATQSSLTYAGATEVAQ